LRLSVKKVRLIYPLFYGFDGGTLEHLGTADGF